MTNIDIVCPFVDNTKEKWQNLYRKYKQKEVANNDLNGEVRFRNWGDFKYWVRSVTTHCNWFRKLIIIVQDEDQIPDWLDTSNERLQIVYHKDYIPQELLPTFNSNVIECFLPLLDCLSENYILCNDDTYFFADIEEDFFFRDNRPVLEDFKRDFSYTTMKDPFSQTLNNNLRFEQKYYPSLYAWSVPHQPAAHSKSFDKKVLEDHWNDFITSFSGSAFRQTKNLTQHLFNDVERITNNCILDKNIYVKHSMFYAISNNSNFRSVPGLKMVCMNDAFKGTDRDFEKTKNEYLKYLSMWLPKVGEFEMKNKIKVSIIVPVWNQKDLVVRALDSIPARDDIEVIVCDDCSTDGTYEVLKNYNRIPIKLFRNEVNSGAGATRNVCFDNCTGDYIFGLDSDDMLFTKEWEKVVDSYLDQDYDYVHISRQENNGFITSGGTAFHTFFLKRSTLGDHRCQKRNRAEDWYLYNEIHATIPNLKQIGTNIVAYRYNYPREGSITWNYYAKGISD